MSRDYVIQRRRGYCNTCCGSLRDAERVNTERVICCGNKYKCNTLRDDSYVVSVLVKKPMSREKILDLAGQVGRAMQDMARPGNLAVSEPTYWPTGDWGGQLGGVAFTVWQFVAGNSHDDMQKKLTAAINKTGLSLIFDVDSIRATRQDRVHVDPNRRREKQEAPEWTI